MANGFRRGENLAGECETTPKPRLPAGTRESPNYCGIVPGTKQSSDSEAKGLRMTKVGSAIMRWALFQAG